MYKPRIIFKGLQRLDSKYKVYNNKKLQLKTRAQNGSFKSSLSLILYEYCHHAFPFFRRVLSMFLHIKDKTDCEDNSYWLHAVSLKSQAQL